MQMDKQLQTIGKALGKVQRFLESNRIHSDVVSITLERERLVVQLKDHHRLSRLGFAETMQRGFDAERGRYVHYERVVEHGIVIAWRRFGD